MNLKWTLFAWGVSVLIAILASINGDAQSDPSEAADDRYVNARFGER